MIMTLTIMGLSASLLSFVAVIIAWRSRQQIEHMGAELAAMNKTLQRCQDQLDQSTREAPYTLASRLLTDGVDVKEVMSRCGLSRPEADLLHLMIKQMNSGVPRH